MLIFFSILISFLVFVGVVGFIIYSFYLLMSKKNPITPQELQAVQLPKYSSLAVGLVVLAYNLFVYHLGATQDMVAGLGLALFNFILFMSFFLVFPRDKRSPLVYAIVLLGLLAGLSTAFRANEFVQLMNLAVIDMSFFLLSFLYVFSAVRWEGLWLIRSIVEAVIRVFRHGIILLKLIFQPKASPTNSGLLRSVKTVVITFIVLMFFAALLSSADPVFQELIKDVKDEAGERTFISLALTVALIFLFTMRIPANTKGTPTLRFLGFYDVLIPVLGMEILFALFIFIQAKYLFGSHVDLQSFDITYSDYVRKGFVELLITTFFGSLVAYLVILKEKTFDDLTRQRVMKVVNVLLLFLLAALLASAFKRDLLYMDAYGLTRIRLIGSVFLAWLGAFLALLMTLNLWTSMKEKHFLGGLLTTSTMAFLFLNLVNVDRVIASYVVPEGHNKDYFYINNLSPDALEGWSESIQAAMNYYEEMRTRPEISEFEKSRLADFKLALLSLEEKRGKLDDKFGSQEDFEARLTEVDVYDWDNWEAKTLKAERSWTSWNWSEANAYTHMQEQSAVFYDALDCLNREIADYQIYTHTDLYDQEYDRLYSYDYPFLVLTRDYYPRSVDSMIYDAFNDDGMHPQLEAFYGSTYPSIEKVLADEFGVYASLKALHTPDSCLSTTR